MSEAGSDRQKQTGQTTDELAQVIDAELKYIAERRQVLGLQCGTARKSLVGLALSGGGIRSATFNLGLLQGLAKHQALQHVDYLSTVSGGGYIGACLTSLLHSNAAGKRREKSAQNRRGSRPSTDVDSFPFRFTEEQGGNERPELKHLRGYGTYLMPSGRLFSPDFWRLIGMYLTGVVINNLVPFAIILVLAFLSKYFVAALTDAHVPQYGYWSAGGLLSAAVAVRAVAAGFELSHRSRKIRGNLVATLVSMSAIVALLSGVIHLVVQKATLSERLAPLQTVMALDETATMFDLIKIGLGALSGASLLGLTAGLVKSEGKRLRPVLSWIFTAARVALIPLLLLQALIWLSGTGWIDRPIVLLAALIMAAASLLINPNRTSMHHFYRDRLSTAYVIKTDDDGRIDSNEELDLADLYPKNGRSGAPYHLINATLNVPSTSNIDLRGRGAAPFLYSAFYCGSEPTGYRKTERYTNYGDTRLATALAVSGAATSPQMGCQSSPAQTFLMTLLNLRLNRWVPNPKHSYRLFGRSYPARLWPLYFFYELLNKGTEKGRLLNLSDGGHFENLGIYSLLQRRCRFIIASDASMDENFEFRNLSDLVRRARIDLGIDLRIRRNGLTPVDGLTPTYHLTAEIEYPGQPEPGILIYVKTGMRGDEPLDLADYKRRTEQFPDESTNDQFFDEPQFESYRKLGELAAKEICESGGAIGGGAIETFFSNAHAHYNEYCKSES